MSEKGKPFLIEYLSPDGALINKFKFVLKAATVAELRDKIVEKLISKDQIEKDTKIVLKDIEDFELGSDDEVEDVLPDGRLRVYQHGQGKPQPVQVQVVQQQPVQQAIVQQPPSQLVPVPPQASNIGVEVPIISLQNWTIPKISENYPKDKVLKVICPQIRKAPFELECPENQSFHELSRFIIKQFNLDATLKAHLYTDEGQPLLFNLDLQHLKVPKLDFSKNYNIIFHATSSPADQLPAAPAQITNNQVNIKVTHKKATHSFKIDLQNSLIVLKYKIFVETGIHPANQIIKFGGNPLTNDAETLLGCGVKADGIMELFFRVISNVVPASYSDKFFYKDVQMMHPQETEPYRLFKSHLLAFGFHLSVEQSWRVLSFLRLYTANEPFVCALRTMFFSGFLSQAHKIALQEGFYTALWHYLKGCNPSPKTEVPYLFNHTRDLLGFILETTSKHTSHSDAEFEKVEQHILINGTCAITTKPIKFPGLIKLDDGKTALIDRNQMSEQIDKGYTFPLLKSPKKTQIFDNYSLFENYDIYHFNTQIDDSSASLPIAGWLGKEHKPLAFNVPALSSSEKYEPSIETYSSNLKVHKPLEIKNKSSIYLMLTNKEGEYRIFVSKNKDINRPHNIFDVITGKEEAVNLDLMMAAGKTQNLEEVVDPKDLKPVITREPKEAIVVLFDISGSMGCGFFNETDLLRIGACKLFFEALAYRTIAYSFEHVVSLTFFDSQIEVQCDFTEAIYDFNRLVSAAKPRSTTRLYDSIINAVNQLTAFKKRYPDCVLRILALTDGEDVGSTHSVFDAAKAVITNDIVMDSFAVGTNCEGLKEITIATGGKCYLTRNMEESLKLFEQETVLSVRARNVEYLAQGKTDAEVKKCLQIAKLKPFDMGNSVYEFKKPEIKGPGLSAADVAKKYGSEEGQKKISGNASLKRIAKEIQNYNENPHPFVAIYPCENINVWKILLLGPKETPYENGLFLLYANFPGDYPFRAPEVRFITPIYHCNMNQQGRICHSVFDRNYSPAITFRHIIDCVYGLILTPEPDDPLDNVIASYFLSEYEVYLKNAKEATAKNASKTTVELVEQLFGKISDDIERQKKVEQLDKWIEKAKSFN